MAEPSPPPPPPAPPAPAPPPAAGSNTPDPTPYWCYQCDKRVPVETIPDHPDVICFECKNGFVESIAVSVSDEVEQTPVFGNEFVQILRLIAEAAPEDEEPPPPPPDSDRNGGGDENDYLRIELDGWDNGEYVVTDEEEQEFRDQVRARWYYDDEDDDDNNDNDNYDEHEVEEEEEEIENYNEQQIGNRIEEQMHIENRNNQNESQIENRNELQIGNRIGDPIENRNGVQIENRSGEEEGENDNYFVTGLNRRGRDRRDMLRLRLREVASRAASRHNRILDWAEMLMGLEDQSIEFRFQVTGDSDYYVGNPGDYVDAAGYEALLQTLAETDNTGRRGAPPAAKSAVENLITVEVKSTDNEICAVCKEKLFNTEGKIAKKLDCGHLYHGECIVPWLGVRNTCPVCRYELPTDDPEYEEERKRRAVMVAASEHGCSSSSGGGD